VKKVASENDTLCAQRKRAVTELINILSALLAPTVAVLGITFTVLQWRTSEKGRQNDLFDRRYAFYMRLREAYLSQHDKDNPPLEFEDWFPLAEDDLPPENWAI
jgi:hypothetical protein